LRKTIIIYPPETNSELIGGSISWNEFMNRSAPPVEFEQLPFDHPLYILYSSGTTGAPKCIVHSAGGTLIQHFKELSLHTNINRDDILFYFTTCGWMMWNWLVSALSLGTAIFLYDGSPGYPDMGVLWKALQDERITIFGTSPKFLTSCQKKRISPGKDYDLTTLNTILSTGSPLSDENFQWVYANVKSDVQLSSISGGTDIVSCFMLGNPMLPVYSEEIQCRGLGMKVEAFDDDGNSLIDEKGELVCTKPFPSMPVYFWNDPGNKKYRSAYFDHFPGVWRHGDYISITGNDGVIVYGRSDATLNPGGVRIGTAEIYRIVESMEEIADSIVVGHQVNNDVGMALFVVPNDGIQLTEKLIIKIKTEIRKNLTARHVPELVREISEVPVTLNGKKVEMAVSRILNGEPVTNKASMANPESLKQFENLRKVNNL
ncbi:acetoacetate--CoA ligase, partial [candidate division KSB1 bacterium]|nr:acetoacetate--CoA ligase [candidate division KSB1 bacterium]